MRKFHWLRGNVPVDMNFVWLKTTSNIWIWDFPWILYIAWKIGSGWPQPRHWLTPGTDLGGENQLLSRDPPLYRPQSKTFHVLSTHPAKLTLPHYFSDLFSHYFLGSLISRHSDLFMDPWIYQGCFQPRACNGPIPSLHISWLIFFKMSIIYFTRM